MKRLRLSTLLLLVVIAALAIDRYGMMRREARLRAALALYRSRAHEAIVDRLGSPCYLPYPQGATLEDVLKLIKARSTGPALASGFPIYVDPVGLHEVGATMLTPVTAPPTVERLTLDTHLRRMLRPMGLAYRYQDGLIVITSEVSLDVPAEQSEADLYREYRDVLR